METIRMLSMTGDFNPRSRKESDNPSNQLFFPLAYFNPRSRKESDVYMPLVYMRGYQFQSTLSQGERQEMTLTTLEVKLFQSTLSQGERQLHIVHACSIPSKYRYFTKTIYNTTSKNQ